MRERVGRGMGIKPEGAASPQFKREVGDLSDRLKRRDGTIPERKVVKNLTREEEKIWERYKFLLDETESNLNTPERLTWILQQVHELTKRIRIREDSANKVDVSRFLDWIINGLAILELVLPDLVRANQDEKYLQALRGAVQDEIKRVFEL